MVVVMTKAPPKAEATFTKELKEGGTTMSQTQEKETVQVPDTISQPGKVASEPEGDASVPWCTVGVNAAYTHNMGNYCSAKVSLSLFVPAAHTEIDQVYDFAQEWVNARLGKAIEELQA